MAAADIANFTTFAIDSLKIARFDRRELQTSFLDDFLSKKENHVSVQTCQM